MKFINIKRIIGLAVLLSVVGLTLASVPSALADDNIHSPDLPPICNNVQVPFGNKVLRNVYALGVQIYRWNGTSWDFVAPICIFVRQRQLSRESRHSLCRTDMGKQQWK